MTMITYKTPSGMAVNIAINEAIAMAKRTGCPVRFYFNYYDILLSQDSTFESVCAEMDGIDAIFRRQQKKVRVQKYEALAKAAGAIFDDMKMADAVEKALMSILMCKEQERQ